MGMTWQTYSGGMICPVVQERHSSDKKTVKSKKRLRPPFGKLHFWAGPTHAIYLSIFKLNHNNSKQLFTWLSEPKTSACDGHEIEKLLAVKKGYQLARILSLADVLRCVYIGSLEVSAVSMHLSGSNSSSGNSSSNSSSSSSSNNSSGSSNCKSSASGSHATASARTLQGRAAAEVRRGMCRVRQAIFLLLSEKTVSHKQTNSFGTIFIFGHASRVDLLIYKRMLLRCKRYRLQ